MEIEPDAGILFDHMEHFLGPVDRSWKTPKNGQYNFEIFEYANKLGENKKILTSFGLFQHRFRVEKSLVGLLKIEIFVCVNLSVDSKALASMLISVGREMLRRHAFPGLHEVFLGEGPIYINGNPLFEHFYLSTPRNVPSEFAACEATSEPILMVQLIPISQRESDFISTNGWSKFEMLINKNDADIIKFDDRIEIV